MASLGGKLDFYKLENARKICQRICRRFITGRSAPGSSSYYVLLPEVPTDTKESNPLLRVEDYPKFSDITPDLCISGCAKRSIEFDVEIGNFLETLKENKKNLTFENIFNPLEEHLVPLNYAWRTAKHLSYVKSDTLYRDAFKRVHPQVGGAKSQRWLTSDLYLAVKDLNTNHRNSMTDCQTRMLDMYLLEGKLNGAHLSGEDRKIFANHLFKLAELKNHFRNKVLMTSNLFSHTIYDFHIISEFPKDFLSQISLDKDDPFKGPWKVTLKQGVYNIAMSHCCDRMTRWNLWYAYNNRASRQHDDKNLSNHVIIEDIRSHRKDIAQFLKYRTYADMSMEAKMAGSVESVVSFIDLLKQRFQPLAEEEMARLQEFATSEGFLHKLEAWDVSYWRRRRMEHYYKLDVDDLTNYFALTRVLEYLFTYSRLLFGLRFEDRTGEVEVWNENVKFYKIYDDKTNQQLSALYLDPYARPGEKLDGAWLESGRECSNLLGLTPFSYFCMNLNQPESGKPCLVTFIQLQQLFFEFGHGLQQLATSVPYSEVSGQRNIEWDALRTSANLFKMILNTRQTLRSMSSHYLTGEPLSDDVINTIMKRRHHMNSFDNMIDLYYSALDLEMHINTDKSWYTLMQKMWGEFVPLRLDDGDNHVCSLTSIFSDNYPAAYYSFKWSEMLACDIFKTFRNASKESPEKVEAVGNRYRETFLSLGGSVPASEVFRRFQGRDPNPDAFVSYYLR